MMDLYCCWLLPVS